MKRILFVLVFCLVGAVGAQGQQVSPGSFKERLSLPDTLTGSRVVLHEEEGAGPLVDRVQSLDKKVHAYRICIFYDNSQQARSAAIAEAKRFEELFPDIPVFPPIYQMPVFKVMAGKCLTMDEAIIVLGRVKGVFDKAYIANEELPLALFLPPPVEEVPDSLPPSEPDSLR